MTRRRIALATTALALAFTATAAASSAHAAPPEDPWESFNRSNYSAHDALDQRILRPLARLYHALTPGIIGQGIHNVLVNLSEPGVFANDVLQVRPRRAARTGVRFVANSLAGWGGLMDVAGKAGIRHKDNDFGITLGVWGVKPGPYLFAPLVGPTTVRDLAGTVIQAVADPMRLASYRSRTQIDITVAVVGGLDKRYQSDADLTTLLAGSNDPYATLRSAYLQDRQANVDDRDAPPANLPDIESTPSPAGSDTAPPAADPAAAQPAPRPQDHPQTQAMLDPDGPIATAGADTARGAL